MTFRGSKPPYCGRFVTNHGAQARRLREIALEAKVDSDVLSYDEFRDGFSSLSWKAKNGTQEHSTQTGQATL